jgi:capsular exopolysaccharide synthesis family protein
MSKIQEALQKAKKTNQVNSSSSDNQQKNALENSSIATSIPETITLNKTILDPHLVVHLEPEGAIADQFRTLRTIIRLSERTKQLQKIIISSPSQKEGKTTICLNLGIALAAESDTNVLVVDTDFRNPTIHKMLGLRISPGLYNLLAETSSFDQTIYHTGISNFHIIPAGKQLANPTDILNSNAMKEFLIRAANQYDYILLDAPPIIPVPDATIFAEYTDGIILVVTAEQTRIPALSSALSLLEKANINVIGLILNKLRSFSSEYRYRYGND